MKPTASTTEVLQKMEDIYGNIRSGDSIVHDFYSAEQQADETVSDWGIRIETLFNKAVERNEIDEDRKESKLKERFWRGLEDAHLRMNTRSSFESKDSFDTLRKKARIEELEMRIERKRQQPKEDNQTSHTSDQKSVEATHQPIRRTSSSDNNESKLDLILNKMKEMEQEIKTLKETEYRQTSNNGNELRRGRGNYYRSDRRNWRRSGCSDRDGAEANESSQQSPQSDTSSQNQELN